MEPIRQIRSRTVVLPSPNIDTDQIIPARFLRTTTREGLGKNLFNDWRYDAAGGPRADFILNDPATRGAQILVGGRNFGCGSSREHAPWALLDYGFRAVISSEIADIFRSNAVKNGLVPVVVDESAAGCLLAHPGTDVIIDIETSTLELPDGRLVRFPLPSFGDIFFNNCFKNGILPIRLPREVCDRLIEDAKLGGNARLTVDLDRQVVVRPNGEEVHFEIDPFRKHLLLNGLDDIGQTLQHATAIDRYEDRRRVELPWVPSTVVA